MGDLSLVCPLDLDDNKVRKSIRALVQSPDLPSVPVFQSSKWQLDFNPMRSPESSLARDVPWIPDKQVDLGFFIFRLRMEMIAVHCDVLPIVNTSLCLNQTVHGGINVILPEKNYIHDYVKSWLTAMSAVPFP